jgi:CHAD domain-containing protein
MVEQQGTHEEREIKFDVPDGFELPDLDAAAQELVPGSSVARSVVTLTSTYFDTDANDLLRQRMTLRKREGDADTGWHLKVPNDLARTEIRVPLTAGRTVPAKLAKLVRGVALGAPLRPVAVLDTERHRTQVRDSDGNPIVEVADDHVRATATGASMQVSTWREVEIELGDREGAGEAAGEDVLAAFGSRLGRAGATESASGSKLARALGQQDAPATKKITASSAITDYLRAQFAEMTAGDVALRRGLDAVHKTRVAARRTRSILRVFAPALDPSRVTALEPELSWYQDLLGDVRDYEVQRALLLGAVRDLPPELALGPVSANIDQALRSEQLAARKELVAALDSERYLQLMRDLRDFTNDPSIADGTTKKDVRRLAADARSTAAKRLARATRGDVDPVELHRARKATKRARYATELAALLGGGNGDVQKTVKRHEDVQEILGDHQDAVVAADNLRRLGAATGTRPGHNGFSYGLLYERQIARQHDLRRRIAKFDL